MPTDVTVLGLGPMGRALAGAFLAAGHSVTVWNRTAGKAEELAARGARVAATAAEAVGAAPLTVVCVLDDAAVWEVLTPLAGTLGGRTLVNLTNGTPEQARRVAEWAAEQDAEYLDGGIMAVPPLIGGSEAFILYSGSERAFQEARDALNALGRAVFLGADAGRAALYDLALLAGMYGMFGGFYQAAAMVTSAGVPAARFAPLLVSWLTAMLDTLPGTAAGLEEGAYDDGSSDLEMQLIAFDNIRAAAHDLGVGDDLLRPLRDLYERALAARREGGAADLLGLMRRTAGD
ncbi:NAD(P)-dependent oxidoreductase [Thermomonospora catenispora]|uniref:NAD(P)-dependent oxidoreductase n=1 Tax=Thermomonospora catenispora TaxID=2493090 RepID=UPI00111EDFB1|nr:NAD(P)-binding domain-containing protein [Thermomonospora catenispora]TNY35989.1 NAD(P)-dependent oxidoreductase [Thermomonospora catenispora]